MTFRNRIFIVIILLITVSIHGQDNLKILFIGNSLTYSNNMPQMVAELAKANNKNLEIQTWTPPGRSLRNHANNSVTYDKINEQKWDFVILQSDDITAFDDMYYIEINCINKLLTGIKDNHSSTKVIYEMVWGIEDSVVIQGEGTYTFEEYADKIYEGTLYIADQLGLQVAPVGSVWKRVLRESPRTDLFASDGMHPALRGSYLAACVFYSTIYQELLGSNTYYNTINPEEALYYQTVASETVMNDLEKWNLVTDLESREQLPTDLHLADSFPNPFNPSTTIVYSIPAGAYAGWVALRIFDLLGREIATLVDEQQSAGTYTYRWHAHNFPSGIYFYSLQSGNYCLTKKMVLLR